MAIIQLGNQAIDYVTSALKDAGGIALAIDTRSLMSPVVFAPESVALAGLGDLDAGGITTQLQADTELGKYISCKKKQDFQICSVLVQDPWIDINDIQRLEVLPKETLNIDDRAYYLYDIRAVNVGMIRKIRAQYFSFLKLIYLSTLSVESSQEILRNGGIERFTIYASSVRFIAINACDDETWIVVGQTPKSVQRRESGIDQR